MNVSTKQARIAALARNNPSMVITSLNHYLDMEWLQYAYERTRKDGAAGIDGQTAADYEANLAGNLTNLLERLKSGRYKAPPVRRAYIPKADGSQRLLGIPTFEDKVAQRAIVMLLEPIYEADFLACSYGFRPGRSAHQALRDLRSHILEQGGRWALDIDIQKYFDTIEHGHLRGFLDRRVTDGVIRRMIDKWLKAGVLENGNRTRSGMGTPQGGVVSPLLANIYLHYVLDEWYQEEVMPRMKGRNCLVRYCDDFVMVFEDFLDSERVMRVLGKRLHKYGLTLHPQKTRRIDFRFKRPHGVRHPATQATTFDFLGFTHVWGKSRKGKNVVYQRTAKDRYARGLKAVNVWCKRNRHRPMDQQHVRLSQMLRGHYAYYGITGNSRRLRWFYHRVEQIWFYWLARRTRGGKGGPRSYKHLSARYPLPMPRIVRRYTTASEAAT